MKLIDIGANLGHESFASDLDQVLSQAEAVGIETLMVTGASMAGSADAFALTQKHPHKLFSTAGIHPHHAEECSPANIQILKTLAENPEVRAIGETGLDYFRDFTPRNIQLQSFEAHIELAIETGLPMFLHERDAADDFITLIKKYRNKLSNIVVHCFTGEQEALAAYLDMDAYIGITGWICDERRGEHLKELVKQIPDSRLMIETDAPYLMPRTIRPKPKSRRNEPKYLPYVCDLVAASRGQTSETIAELTTANAQRFFNL